MKKIHWILIAAVGLVLLRLGVNSYAHHTQRKEVLATELSKNTSFANGIAQTNYATVEITGHQIIKPDKNRELYKDATLMLINFKATNKAFEEGPMTPEFLFSTAFAGTQEDKANKSEQGLDTLSVEYLGIHNSEDRVEIGQTAEGSVAFVIRDNSKPLKLVAHNFAIKDIGSQYLPLQ
ncbi:DUF5067 domain-containing protein [Holzapfeliella sp. He02]|uniref:DUF5067 domain-containing protein n=1 Tax=Holzapfeliella saturejae TaxID=3082953 RepID=A0ABU8SHM9_9LACO